MPAWHSLYLPSVEQTTVVNTLQESLTALGYTPFDPFGLIPGKSYPHTVRLFVAPGAEWIRIIGEPDEGLLSPLSKLATVLYMALDGDQAKILTYANGETINPLTTLTPYARQSAEDLRRALDPNNATLRVYKPDSALPFESLPNDVQSMAGQVDMQQAQSMFARLSGQLMKKAGGDNKDAANLLKNAPEWSSPGGQRITALMGALTVSNHWRDPDFVTLRDGYQLLIRRQRTPNARLYPGDAEAMAQVPNALEYVPVYAGK